MSQVSEDQFDLLVEQAKSSQTIQLYFLAIMPNGKAINVTARMLPEELEQIGVLKTLKEFSIRDMDQYRDYMESHGKKLAELMTRVTNPMIQTLFNKGIELLQEPDKTEEEK